LEDYSSFLVTFSGNAPEDLKQVINEYYLQDNIEGVMLIGDLPSAWYEMNEEFRIDGRWQREFVEFPIDHFYTDLDGQWIDSDDNEIYDKHTGNMEPEIWLGRIKADNLNIYDSDEAEIINSYFAKNHLYRKGLVSHNQKALAYIDDDWAGSGLQIQSYLQNMYEEVELVNEPEITTAELYKQKLVADYEYIQVNVHSNPTMHFFDDTVTNQEIINLNPTAYFYNLFCCSNCHFEESNNMGSLYFLGNDHGLGVVGSTKSGSMLFFNDYYYPLSQGSTFGEAFQIWWSDNVDTATGNEVWERSWFYGMVYLGDATLKPFMQQETTLVVDADFNGDETGTFLNPYNSISEAIDQATDGYTILVEPGNYQEQINFAGKKIQLRSFYGPDSTFLSYNQGRAVIFDTAADSTTVLDGFTIENSAGGIWVEGSPKLQNLIVKNNQDSPRGGGIVGYNSNTIIENCQIYNNIADWGGGVSFSNSNITIRNSSITSNLAEWHGGGICSLTSNLTLQNVKIQNNTANQHGGALFFNSEGTTSNALLENVLVTGNSANITGGLHFYYSSQVEANFLTVYNNQAESGAALGLFGSAAQIQNSIFANNSQQLQIGSDSNLEIDFCDVEDGEPGINNLGELIWGENNLQTPPQFTDPENEDFTLMRYSQCIGNANPETCLPTDIAGNPRPSPTGSAPDMGCYENATGSPAFSLNHVSPAGSDLNGNGSLEAPFATIQHAIDNIFAGDSLLVHTGTYSENINLNGKNIKIISQEGPLNTVIEGDGTAPVVIFESGENHSCTLQGFTIKGGYSATGGGIKCTNQSNPTLKELIITQNAAMVGGGIHIHNSVPVCLNLTIADNTAENLGSAIAIWQSQPLFLNCTVWENSDTAIYGAPDFAYCNLQTNFAGMGNICQPPEWNTDYSLTPNSPCVDSGIDQYQWQDLEIIIPDYVGSAPDMGALEYGQTANDIPQPAFQTSLHNYPNPFNPQTCFSYNIKEDFTKAELQIYNIKGQKVKSFNLSSKTVAEIIWHGTNDAGQKVASGIYFGVLNVDGKQKATRKLLLLK
jgi:hypothetical protein